MDKRGKLELKAQRPMRRPKPTNPAATFRAKLANPLGGPIEALRKAMVRTRGTDAQQELRHVQVALAKMTGTRLQCAVEERMQATQLSKQRVSAMSQYAVYCAETGRGLVFPITAKSVKGWLTWSVFKGAGGIHTGRAVASHTLSHHLSNLRVAARAMGEWAVSETEKDSLNLLVGQLQAAYPSLPARTVAVPVEALVSCCERLRREGSLKALQTRALAAVSAGTLARGTEVAGEGGMRFGDFTLDHRGMAFGAMFSKMGKRTLAARVRVFPHMPKDLAEICPTRCLLEYKAAWGAAGGEVSDEAPLWRKVDADGKPTAWPMTVADSTAAIRSELAKEGVDPKIVGDHWARHTGRRILQYELEFGTLGADIMGDWKPASEGGNAKSRGELHYAHPTVEEAWRAAMVHAPKGFATHCCKRR